jgi:hypothetical protein
MTCVCRGQSLVMERHARAHTIDPRVPQLRPTVFVDAIPELAAERRRRLSELIEFRFPSYRNDAA